jgi:hypothetical protein
MSVDGQGNATSWIFNMKNRFGWRSEPVVEDQKDTAPIGRIEIKVVGGEVTSTDADEAAG